jgi:hypothetical protein
MRSNRRHHPFKLKKNKQKKQKMERNHIKMKKYSFYLLLSALTLAPLCGLTSCDDGAVVESNSTDADVNDRSVTLEGTLSGWDGWADGMSVALAGFEDDNDYAIISKPVTTAEGLTLSQIPENVTTVALCVINRLRQRVATFQEIDFTQQTATMNVGALNVSMYSCIQQTVFNTTCAHCHGGSNFAAAGLNLTEGKSYNGLVNHASKKVDGGTLVVPGDAEESVLTRVLGSSLTSTWGYDHSKEVLDANVLSLIDSWINAGASE